MYMWVLAYAYMFGHTSHVTWTFRVGPRLQLQAMIERL